MARLPELEEFAEAHKLKLISIADLIAYRRKAETLIRREAETDLPTKYGLFRMIGYTDTSTGEHHTALVHGDISQEPAVLVRVHSECLTGDAFGSTRCDCGEQLEKAFQSIAAEGCGVIVYMRQEGRGIGLINKIKAYELQDNGMDTVEANLALGFPDDLRDYGIGAQILADLGVSNIRLMTNNPKKINGLSGYGMEVVERVPLSIPHNACNETYFRTKQSRLGHLLQKEGAC